MQTITINAFYERYSSTGKMIKSGETGFVQTYRRDGASYAEADYRVVGQTKDTVTLEPVFHGDYI